MTGTTCSVAVCKSNAIKAKKEGHQILFFNFPKEVQIRKEWIRRCHRKDKWTADNKRICSKHFNEEDYEDYIKSKLMNTHPRKLKPSAIPSLHLLPRKTVVAPNKKAEREHAKERKRMVEELLRSSTPSPVETSDLEVEALDMIPSVSPESEVDILRRQLHAVSKENECLRKLLDNRDDVSQF